MKPHPLGGGHAAWGIPTPYETLTCSNFLLSLCSISSQLEHIHMYMYPMHCRSACRAIAVELNYLYYSKSYQRADCLTIHGHLIQLQGKNTTPLE